MKHLNFKNSKLNNSIKLSELLLFLEKDCYHSKIYNLDKIRMIAQSLNLFKVAPFVFTVTGTNGKGTTCFALEKYLILSGYRVGLYTSPHLIKYIERVRINGKYIKEKNHVNALLKIILTKGNISLTYFEIITLSALYLFKKSKLDVLILEVGIGGRLDATNIIDADISIITNIGIDHTDRLGLDRESIGYEKSGIFRSNKIAIIGDINIPNSVILSAKNKNVVLKKIDYDWFIEHKDKYWNFITFKKKINYIKYPNVPLESVSIALAALYFSDFDLIENIVQKMVSSIRIPGRFQTISKFPHVILDVCHNPHAALYLAKKISIIKKKRIIHSIVGMLKDKDIYKTIQPFKNLVNFWYCVELNTHRTLKLQDWNKYLDKYTSFKSVSEAFLNVFNNSNSNDIILVYGSFFIVSEILLLFSKKKLIR